MVLVIWCLAAFGGFISLLNFYLSFIRQPLHRLLQPERPFRWISGFPLVGSLALWLAAAGFWWAGNTAAALSALGVSLLDTGGFHWFALEMIRQRRTTDR